MSEKNTESAKYFQSSEDIAHLGVRTIEATQQVYGKYSLWFLFISLGLAAYIYSLDGTTTYSYLAFATSGFGHHSLISTIQVAQSIIIAVGKPVIAKVADVQSRGSAYVIVLVFYVIGYIVIASAKNIQAIAGGIIVYAVGYIGLQLLTQIIIADITTLEWRGLVSRLISLPYIINAFVGSNISTSIITHSGWRWGYGMFAILVPAALAPLILTLLWAERKSRALGLISSKQSGPVLHQILDTANKLDIVGLALIGTSVALILLPLTLAEAAKGRWKNTLMIVMIVVGAVLIPVYIIWDFRFTKYPVITKRFVLNRTVVFAALLGAFDFVLFYISYTYLFSFVIVVKPWPLLNATYFAQTQTVALTVFGILAGLSMHFLHRYKYILIVGLAIHLLGCGLMIHSRGANASDAEIVWSQVLQGIGGGFAAVASQVAAQASVPHADMAMITAVVLLVTEIGGSIGGAIAGALWTNMMPGKLAKYLDPLLSKEVQLELFGSITTAVQYPRGDPIREGVIQAYDDVMKTMTIVATAIAVVPLVLSFLMPNWYLGNTQNAVDNTTPVDSKKSRSVQDRGAS
ncbi:drug:h+ antiporter [Macrolepiota fuliginosa MF-IS2]|uniref:Drug:h+ antiporter n=1 Tax=Macrolepiota fuliginosa MF-IS2 TaxID=1400762 RepID=A0A9P6BZ16_9AGAR|nr:drug:h+ antiporter [Macrolepiota fuliginosa MF-IS2]